MGNTHVSLLCNRSPARGWGEEEIPREAPTLLVLVFSFLKKHDQGIDGKPTSQPTGRKSFIQKEEIIMMVSLDR